MKKFLVLFLVLAVSVSLFAAGGSQGAAPGGLTEITHMYWDRGTIPPEQGNYEDNWWTRYVDEKIAPLGAKMRYITIPRAQEGQILSTMLAARNAPDIYKTGDTNLLRTYLTGGGVHDITGYIDRHGPNILSLYGPSVMADIKYEGKVYWLPHLQNGMEVRTTWIRKDWLDAVGMEAPQTPAELIEVLRVIKQRDPGGRGASLLPFVVPAGANTSLAYFDAVSYMGFVRGPITPEKLLTPAPMWPELKEAFRFLNTLFAEGLMSDMFIIDRDESLWRQHISRGNIFAFLGPGHYPYHSAYGNLYDRLRETDPNAVLMSIDTFRPARGAPKNEYRGGNPTYGYRWFVPASTRHAELTVRVMDFLCSEDGFLVGGLGIDQVDYRVVNNVPTPIDRDSYLARVPWIEPQYGLKAKPFPRPQDKLLFLENYIKDFSPQYYDQIRGEANFLSDITSFPPTLSAPTPVADRLSPIVNEFWRNEIVRVVFSTPANFDRLFDDAVREYRSLGGDQIAEESLRLYAQQMR